MKIASKEAHKRLGIEPVHKAQPGTIRPNEQFEVVEGTGDICGRSFKVQRHPDNRHFRILVDGMFHPFGKPIRYKSMDRARADILTKGMAR